MVTSGISELLPYRAEEVWQAVTGVEGYSWRSDLSGTEVLSGTQFIEYAKTGFPTTFTITRSEAPCRWELDIENDRIRGHWTGIFTAQGDKTRVAFTEQISVRKFWMKPFIKGYLKRQQALYLEDLKAYLALTKLLSERKIKTV